jgi:ubiquinone/menaquinone biosynthesis C-methylase UbiE
MAQKIEILSTELLIKHPQLVESLRQTAAAVDLEFGWHYLLDLTWILSQIGPVKQKTILDAGAGVGVMQWHLAENDATVYSVDRSSRANLATKFRVRYRVRGLRPDDFNPTGALLGEQIRGGKAGAAARNMGRAITGSLHKKAPGEVILYNQDLRRLVDLPDSSIDGVVAVSALEHNSPENLAQVVKELVRVLKPGGMLLATLDAGKDEDWFHEASQGWCYTAASLRRLFDLPTDTPDNYADYDALFSSLRQNAELRDNLASFYSQSGNNGMPWGKWDPTYQPVGVLKIKEQPINES